MDKVLDNGFIRLVDSMGNDMSVVKAARVSYGEESKGEKADNGLINYMMKHNHGTPFEHIVFTFHVKCPIFVARQWFRHRIGSFNEISGRYVRLETDVYMPEHFRTNSSANRQVSSNTKWDMEELITIEASYETAIKTALEAYEDLLEVGVAKEQARAILPLGVYTEFYWTVNARSLMNFINLRGSSDAQWEIQQYAEKIKSIALKQAPVVFKAYFRNGE